MLMPLEVFLYMSLFLGGLIFSWETVKEYFSGSTSYSVTKEPVTLHDLPTIAICWQFSFERVVYGQHFNMRVKIGNESNIE